MDKSSLLHLISIGRTDLVLHLFEFNNWQEILKEGQVKLIQWLVYYDDLTAIKWIISNGGNLDSINLNEELGNAAFFGHWKICDFLLNQGADVNYQLHDTHETPLHNALCKAGRPYYLYTVKTLLHHGADPNLSTNPGMETGSFMRDARTYGETPLHRAAAYGSDEMIRVLLDHGADKTIKDSYNRTPLSIASFHLRPGIILSLLSYGPFRISQSHVRKNLSDHGDNWGNSMDWNLYGSFHLESND